MCCVISLAAFVVASGIREGSNQRLSGEQVVIRNRLSPTNIEKAAEGSCGSNRYRIELQHRDAQTTLSVVVNDRAVSAAEIAKVTSSVRPGYFMYDPAVAECFWDRPNARMRLVTDGPTSHGKAEWLYFDVSPTGKVTNVRPD